MPRRAAVAWASPPTLPELRRQAELGRDKEVLRGPCPAGPDAGEPSPPSRVAQLSRLEDATASSVPAPNAGRSRLDLGSEARSAPLHADPELRDSPQGQLVAPHKLGPTLRPEWAPKSRWPLPEPTVLSLLQGHRAQEGHRAEGRGHRLLARQGRPGISGRGEAGTGQC